MNEWSDKANCLGVDTESFFANEKTNLYDNQNYLIRICNGCTVKKECLDYALHNKVLGWWGGTTENKRKKIRKELGIIAVPVVPDREYA